MNGGTSCNNRVCSGTGFCTKISGAAFAASGRYVKRNYCYDDDKEDFLHTQQSIIILTSYSKNLLHTQHCRILPTLELKDRHLRVL